MAEAQKLLKVTKTLIHGEPKEGSKGEKGGKIVGYVLVPLSTEVKVAGVAMPNPLGVTVEQAFALVAKYGAVNAEAAMRKSKNVGPDGQPLESLFIQASGDAKSLKDPSFLMRATKADGTYHCTYTKNLKAALEKSRGTGTRGARSEKRKADDEARRAAIASALEKRKIAFEL